MKTKILTLSFLMLLGLFLSASGKNAGRDSSGCTAYYNYSLDSNQTLSYHFYGEATGTAPFQYHWNFGDGGYSSQQNPVHTFPGYGNFYVCLTIISSDSCSDSYCSMISIDSLGNGNCHAMYYAMQDSNVYNNTYYFIDASTGNINQWFWNFGDGYSSTEQNPVHTFAQNGSFNVCLTISNSDSGAVCNDTYCSVIAIGGSTNTYTLSGRVTADNQPVDIGTVNVYKADSGFVFVNTTVIDSSGYYGFMLPQGSYIVRAELSPNSIYFGNYAPTYHLKALNWQQALIINLSGDVYNVNVEMIRIDSVPGAGAISGKLLLGSRELSNANAEILLVNSSNQPICYTKTTNSGYFTLGNLSLNSYKVYAEVPGFSSNQVPVTLTQGNPKVNGVIITMTATAINEPGKTLAITSIYPNPVSDKLNLEISLDVERKINYAIYNSTGVLVASGVLKMEQGLNQLSIDASAWTNGIYLLNLTSEDGSVSVTKKIIK